MLFGEGDMLVPYDLYDQANLNLYSIVLEIIY